MRNKELNERFESELLKLVGEACFRMTCVVIDKETHKKKTYRELAHPYHYCLTALLERYAGWLSYKRVTGDVMAESRGGREDQELGAAFSVFQKGNQYCPREKIQEVLTSEAIKLKKKEHAIAGLELADLLAYPFKREMIATQRKEDLPQDFSARLLEAARKKINCHLHSGRTIGYGTVWLD